MAVSAAGRSSDSAPATDAEALAATVEAGIGRLVAGGADEAAVRELVRRRRAPRADPPLMERGRPPAGRPAWRPRRASCSSRSGTTSCRATSRRWQVMDEGDAAAHHFLVRGAGRGQARRRHPVGGGARQPEPPRRTTGSGSSTPSTAPTSSARTAATSGPSTSPSSSTARRSPPPSPCRRSGSPSPPNRRRCCPPRATGRRRLVTSRWRAPYAAATIVAGARRRGVRGSAAPARRRWPWCSATPTSTPTPAACTSGTRRAPAAVAAAAGCHVSRLDGSPLVYNQPRPVAPRPARLPARAGRPCARSAVGLTWS